MRSSSISSGSNRDHALEGANIWDGFTASELEHSFGTKMFVSDPHRTETLLSGKLLYPSLGSRFRIQNRLQFKLLRLLTIHYPSHITK
jgi:hypothetical protein